MSNIHISGAADQSVDCKLDSELLNAEDALSEDRRLVLIVIMLAFFLGLALGITTTSVFADEATVAGSEKMGGVNQSDVEKSEWKPPVAKQVKAPLPINEELRDKIKKEKGVEILSLQLTSAGYMMDFRFRVIDVEKSKIFFDQRIKPYVHVDKSNAKLPVPMAAKVGAFRMTDRGKNVKPNKNYYIVFANPDAHVKEGDKVSLTFGEYKIEGMRVN